MTALDDRPETRPTAGAAASLPAELLVQAAARPKDVALRKKDLGRWKQYTWDEYATRAARVGLGLLELGVQPGDRVAVHSENRPAWLLTDLGAQGIGAVTVGIYPTSPAAEVEYLLGHSESVVVVVEDEEQFDKTWAVRSKLPALRKIVVIDTRGIRDLDDPMVMTFADLEALGAQRDMAEYRRRVTAIDPATAAVMVYTSGTTGPPKGALLSHANLVAAGQAFVDAFGARQDDEVLSYLPLCHIAERVGSTVDALQA
ncbi:MAG TPA: AMP-binding protein, partial [Acidimicrobiales bacterium]|nr:AMP-binding protein [Acidimicrobiales bacterium]